MDLSFEDESECGVCTVVGPPHSHRGRGLCRNPRPCFLRLISRPLQLQKRSMSQRAELYLHRCRLHKLCKVHLPCFPLQVSATCNSDSQKRAHDVVFENQSNNRKAQPRFLIFRSSSSNSYKKTAQTLEYPTKRNHPDQEHSETKEMFLKNARIVIGDLQVCSDPACYETSQEQYDQEGYEV